VFTRLVTVQAITACDVAIIDLAAYTSARDKSLKRNVKDDRFKFLISTPVFRHWTKYDLYRVSPLFKRVEVNKGALLFSKGDVTHELSFLIEGHVDIVNSLDAVGLRNIIVSVRKHEV
jgi:hypothetical protein